MLTEGMLLHIPKATIVKPFGLMTHLQIKGAKELLFLWVILIFTILEIKTKKFKKYVLI